MSETTFYDPLDLLSHSHDPGEASDDRRIASAQLIFALLRGWTPVISQTQAFDSRVILGAAAAGSDHGPSFRWLIREGHIRIPLFRQPTLQDAFIAALLNPHFRFLCWPEVVGKNPTVDRQAIAAMLRTRQKSSELPDDVAARVDTIIALNDTIENHSCPN